MLHISFPQLDINDATDGENIETESGLQQRQFEIMCSYFL